MRRSGIRVGLFPWFSWFKLFDMLGVDDLEIVWGELVRCLPMLLSQFLAEKTLSWGKGDFIRL